MATLVPLYLFYSFKLIQHVIRFPQSDLHRRDPRASSSLFDSYNGDSRPASRSPGSVGGYGYGGYSGTDRPVNGNGSAGGYRGATPNAKYVAGYENKSEASNSKAVLIIILCRGHYSDAVLSHLESQNEEEVEGISAKVKMLKDVGFSQATTGAYLWLGFHIDDVSD